MQKKDDHSHFWLVGLAVVVWLLAACGTLEVGEETPFRSDQFHLEVTLPPGWAGAEGPEYLARPFTGLVAFNSWGEAGFWAPEVTTATSATYSPRSVLGQIPDGGAYVVLVHFSGGPHLPAEQYGPEHERQDLGSLWEQTDCREGGTATGATCINFFKWGRLLRLEVCCDPNASDTTVAAVNSLLSSWRFDQVPAGDVGWAVVEARSLLPPAVDSTRFPLLAGPPQIPGPLHSLVGGGSVVWTTQAQIQGETIVVTFTYRWNEPQFGTNSDDCPSDRCHWWRFEARPSGDVVLVEEGGAAPPGEEEVTQ
jgi:hypothetical protein